MVGCLIVPVAEYFSHRKHQGDLSDQFDRLPLLGELGEYGPSALSEKFVLSGQFVASPGPRKVMNCFSSNEIFCAM